MKKQLLSATALVAVALMAASGSAVAKAKKPKLSIGGYQAVGWDYVNNGDVGGSNTGGLSAITDEEIHFKMSGQLANGVKISGKIELEGGAAETADHIDETWVKFQSAAWGQVILGSTDSASMKLVTGTQWGTSLYNIPFERASLSPKPSGWAVTRSGGPGFSTRATVGDSDDPKVVWISPKFGGLQIGLSYMRDGSKGPDDVKSQSSSSTDVQDHWTTGFKYSTKAGKAKVTLAAGYLTAKKASIGDDISAVVAGVSFEQGPWKVSAGYHGQDDPTSGANSKDGAAYEAGIRYTAGAHKYSLAGFHGEVAGNTTVSGDDESDTMFLAHTYAVGPGVTWRNALGCTSWEGEASGGSEDQSGCGVHTGMKISF